MDITNCTTGFATDVAFVFGVHPPCGVRLMDYDITISIMLITRLMTCWLSWHDWIAKKRKFAPTAAATVARNKTNGQSVKDYRERRKWEQRFPVVPLIGTMLLILWLIMFLLVRFNVSSAANGVTMLLWSLTFIWFAWYSLLFERRLIRLGKRIIPISKAKLDIMVNSSSSDAGGTAQASTISRNLDRLQYFDHTLSAIVCGQLVCVVVQTICGCILALVFPGELIYMQIAFAVEGIFIIGNMTALSYQMTRVANCVKDSTMDPSTKAKVLQKLRSQQLHLTTIAASSFVINVLLAAQVIPIGWYMMIYWIAVEISVSSFAVIEAVGTLCFRRRRQGHGKKITDQLATTGQLAGDEAVTRTATTRDDFRTAYEVTEKRSSFKGTTIVVQPDEPVTEADVE